MLSQIESKGETFNEHLMCLFKAFETSHDPVFKNYVQTFKDKWEDGENLMDCASKKYKSLHEAGTWKSKDVNRQQIVALTTAINSMTKSFAKTQYTVKPKEDGKPKKGKGKGKSLMARSDCGWPTSPLSANSRMKNKMGKKEVRRRKLKGKAVESQASSQAQNLPPL